MDESTYDTMQLRLGLEPKREWKLQISKGKTFALIILDLGFLGGRCGESTGWGKHTDLHAWKTLQT